jgi:hypothetical protein
MIGGCYGISGEKDEEKFLMSEIRFIWDEEKILPTLESME